MTDFTTPIQVIDPVAPLDFSGTFERESFPAPEDREFTTAIQVIEPVAPLSFDPASLESTAFPPGAPTALTATAGVASVALAWTAPTNTGGVPLTDYAVQYRTTAGPGEWVTFTDAVSTATSATVTGLANGTGYDFRVAAVNSGHTGAYSSTASATTFNFAGAPTGLTATPGNAQAALSWTAPASNGGTAVTDYSVQYRTSPDGSWSGFGDGTATGGSAPWTLADLPTAPAMWFDASDASTFTITSGRVEQWRDKSGNNRHVGQSNASLRPAREDNIVNSQAAVRWDSSNRVLGTSSNISLNDFDLFVVFRDSGQTAYERLVDHDFDNGFWVGRDNTTASAWRSGVRESGVPYGRAVSGLTDGQWHIIQSGRSGTQHTIRGNGGTGVSGTVSSTATASNPIRIGGANGERYLINGDIAEVILVPAALSTDDRQRMEGYLAHKWGIVSVLPSSHPFKAAAPTVSTLVVETVETVTGLTNGTAYDFQVAAVNAVGTGDYSTPATTTPFTVPGAATGLTATPGDGTLTVAFTPGMDNGSAITNHEYSLDGGEWVAFDPADTSSPVTIDGLANGTEYEVRLRAVNAAGAGAASAAVTATPYTTPGQVTDITLIEVTPYDFTVAWTAPESDGGSTVTDYTIEYRLIGAPTFDVYADGVDTEPTAIVGELEPATEYEFRIAAVNAAGTGPFSLPVSVTTTADIPAPLPGMGLKARLAQIAGVPGAELVDAANIWAGSSGESLVTALNLKAGTSGESVKTALNVLAGTTGEEAVVAARKIGGYP